MNCFQRVYHSEIWLCLKSSLLTFGNIQLNPCSTLPPLNVLSNIVFVSWCLPVKFSTLQNFWWVYSIGYRWPIDSPGDIWNRIQHRRCSSIVFIHQALHPNRWKSLLQSMYLSADSVDPFHIVLIHLHKYDFLWLCQRFPQVRISPCSARPPKAAHIQATTQLVKLWTAMP